jgi:drug/metabolite transporter (DMT)-like permease
MPPYIYYALYGALAVSAYGLLTKIILRYQVCSAGFVAFATGVAAASASLIIIIAGRFPFPPLEALTPLLLTGLLAFGALYSVSRAMQDGDPSAVVPMMGLKIPFTAIFSYIMLGEIHTWHIYLAAVLSAIGVALFGIGPQQRAQGGYNRHPRVALLWAAGSAALFAMSDQYAKLAMEFIDSLEVAFFSYVVIGSACLVMLSLPRYRRYRLKPGYVITMVINGLLLLITVFFLFTSFEMADEVTTPNIVFATRGFITIIAGYVIGMFLKYPIERQSRKIYLYRAFGTSLLFTALILIF